MKYILNINIMEIKCSCHPSQASSYLCIDCGFLCERHKEEEFIKGHLLLSINKTYTDLYNEIAKEKQTDMILGFLAMLKEKVVGFADLKMISLDKNKARIHASIKSMRKAKLGFNFDDVCGHILKSVNARSSEDIKPIKNSIIDQVISLLSYYKVECAQSQANNIFSPQGLLASKDSNSKKQSIKKAQSEYITRTQIYS